MAAEIDKKECTGCEACVDVCPVQAIYMEDDKAVVNEDLCVDCSACVCACPVEAISLS